MRQLLRALAITAGALLISAPNANAAWTKYSPPDSEKVDYVINSPVSAQGYFDPIVYPGVANSSHKHVFFNNRSATPSSNLTSLVNAAKTGGVVGQLSRNGSLYWEPALYRDGTQIVPGQAGMQGRIYYRAGTTNLTSVKMPPAGLKILAGNPNATAPQSGGIAGWQCRDAGGNTVPRTGTIPNCPRGDYLESSVTFPNCWDGRNLDSADHRSHMAYASASAACPSSHPVRIPKIVFATRYPTDAQFRSDGTYGKMTLAAKSPAVPSPYTLHADLIIAWDNATSQKLIEHCIHASVGCEGVSNTRLPPSMGGLPPAQWPTATASRSLLCT